MEDLVPVLPSEVSDQLLCNEVVAVALVSLTRTIEEDETTRLAQVVDVKPDGLLVEDVLARAKVRDHVEPVREGSALDRLVQVQRQSAVAAVPVDADVPPAAELLVVVRR